MAKRSRFAPPDCEYVICPLGKGVPFCIYTHVKEHTLATARLRDLPSCPGMKKCRFQAEIEEERQAVKREANQMNQDKPKSKE